MDKFIRNLTGYFFEIESEMERHEWYSDFENAETPEQMASFLNETLDVMCVRFDKAVKEAKEAVADINRKTLELTENLLEENERKHSIMCDEVLEMEEESESNRSKDELPRKRMKSQITINEPPHPDFGDEFCNWLFYKVVLVLS